MIEHRLLRSICHASIGTNDLKRAKAFYTPVLATLTIALVSEYEHAVTYGKGYPEFWLQQPYDKLPATPGNGVHFGFVALNKQQVDDFINALSLWVDAVMANPAQGQNMEHHIMVALLSI